MAKGIVLGIAIFLVLPSGKAGAFEGSYAAFRAGGTVLEDAGANSAQLGTNLETEFETGFGLWAALGRETGPFRVEAELGYRSNRVERFRDSGRDVGGEGEFRAVDLLFNVYLDWRNRTFLVPYLGGGAGAAIVSVNDGRVSGIEIADMNLVYAYQAGAGVGIAISETVILDLGYRFFGTTDARLNDSRGFDFHTEYRSHSILLGARIRY